MKCALINFKVIKAFVLLGIFFSSPLYADITGRWRVEDVLTIGFNKDHTQMSELKLALLSCFVKNSSFEITKEKLTYITKEHGCSFGKKETVIEGHEVSSEYKNIFENENMAILVNKTEEGSDSVTILHKISKDLFWIYFPGESPDYDSHIRHFYTKSDIN